MRVRMILPLESEVLIQSYPEYSISHSIIKGNSEKTYLYWLISKFQNCYFCDLSRNHKFINCMSDGWATREGILKFEFINIDKELLIEQGNVVDLFKVSIEFGAYPFGMSCLFGDKKDNGVIYGYDDLRSCFLYAVHTEKGLSRGRIGYSVFIKALFDSKGTVLTDFVTYNKKHLFEFDEGILLKRLNEYLNSSTTDCPMNDKVYGLKAIVKLIDYIRYSDAAFCGIQRYLRCFYEQKTVIFESAKRLYNKGLVSSDLTDRSKTVLNISQNILKIIRLSDGNMSDRNSIDIKTICESIQKPWLLRGNTQNAF